MPRFRRRRRRSRQPLGATAAEELLAGRGVAPGAPASQQALARVLEIAAGPPTERELADEAAYVAAFVLATSPAGARRAALPRVMRAFAQLTAAVVAAVLVVGGTAAVTGQLPARLQELAHVTLGAPAPHHGSRPQPVARFPQASPSGVPAGLPVRGSPSADTTTRPGQSAARPSPPVPTDIRPKTRPVSPRPEVPAPRNGRPVPPAVPSAS
jgi:hypothetical protein